MKRFGEIKPLERIVQTGALNNFHVVVDSFDKLSTFPDQTVAVFSQDDGEFRKGDVVVKQEDGTWTRLVLLKHGLDPVTRLRAMRFGTRVILRWNDPRDRYDHDGNLLSEFFRTIVVRKFGSEPENEFDGTQIYINYKRNAYNGLDGKPYLVDDIAEADGIGKVFYKAYAVSKDGMVNRNTVAVEAKELTWAEISSMIKQGHAERIFSTGDEIPLPNGNALVCVGFDSCIPQNATKNPHSVTFALKYPFAFVPFDYGKGTYRLTTDTVVLSRKSYYYKAEDGSFKSASLKTGASIPAGVYYESQLPVRGTTGSNRWKLSDIRAWLNSTSEANYGAIVHQLMEYLGANLPPPPLEYLTEGLGEEFVNIILQQKTPTGYPRVDGTATEITGDRFVLPSLTELYGKKNGIHTEGTYLEAHKENVFPRQYIIPSNADQETTQQLELGTCLWTRSALQAATAAEDDGTEVYVVNPDGSYGTLCANNSITAVRWYFSIG